MNYGYVIKMNDDNFIVNVDLTVYGSGYNVVSKEIDPYNAYEIEDVKLYCTLNPDKVLTKHPLEEKTKLLVEKETLEQWLKDHDYIGTKIATGRATVAEYSTEIAEMTVKANRINEIDEELKKGL